MEAEEEGCQKKGMTHNLASQTNIRVRQLTQMWTMTLAWPPALRTDFIVYPPPTKKKCCHASSNFTDFIENFCTRTRARAHTHSDNLFYFLFFTSIHFMKCVDESSTLPFSGDENAHDSYQNKTQYN